MPTQPDDVDALIPALGADCASAVEIVLARAGTRVRAALRDFLDPGREVDRNVRVRAIAALGRLRDDEAVDGIDRLLNGLDGHGRLVAADALGRIGAPRATVVLRRLANDPLPEVRRFAAIAFGRVGTPETRRALQDMRASDADPLVQNAISRILTRSL